MKISLPRTGLTFFVVSSILLLLSSRAHAVPQFARRYKLNCYACHTIPPVLNENGYMFRRLGYHLPPALQMDKQALRIAELVESEPAWSITNNASLAVGDMSFSTNRSTQQGTVPVSTSSFNFSSWNNYWGGWVPNTNFFYYSEFDIVTDGSVSPDLSNAYFGYSGGTAKSSWYLDIGRQHLQIAEGTRAANIYSLLSNSPLLFENASPTTFIIDQSPMGIEAGYTWASSNYKNILAAAFKVTNGDNADGSEILGPSTKNAKDVWFDADWWYAKESGVSFVGYYGRKDEIQTDAAGNQFTYEPRIRRFGVFGNYMILPIRLDLLAGYLHSDDDWQVVQGGQVGAFRGNDYFGDADYYIKTGFAVSARYDRLNQQVFQGPGLQATRQWSAGILKAFTPSGNIVGRLAFNDLSGKDPVTAILSTSKGFQADIAFNW
jgi:hypothetical protein